jgi:hypothetical protein
LDSEVCIYMYIRIYMYLVYIYIYIYLYAYIYVYIGYGRLGHNVGNDEVCPREIGVFQTLVAGKQVPPANPQKQVD